MGRPALVVHHGKSRFLGALSALRAAASARNDKGPYAGLGTCRIEGIRETIRAAWVGRDCGEISAAWVSGSRSRAASRRLAQRSAAEGSAGADQRSAEVGSRAGTEAGESARNAYSVTLCAVRHGFGRDAGRREVSEVRVCAAFVQAVHVFRSGKPV